MHALTTAALIYLAVKQGTPKSFIFPYCVKPFILYVVYIVVSPARARCSVCVTRRAVSRRAAHRCRAD